jgi:hypothetical protein
VGSGLKQKQVQINFKKPYKVSSSCSSSSSASHPIHLIPFQLRPSSSRPTSTPDILIETLPDPPLYTPHHRYTLYHASTPVSHRPPIAPTTYSPFQNYDTIRENRSSRIRCSGID